MIKNIMSTNIIVGNINNNINDISNLMKIYDVGFIPICDNDKIKGVITDRDIVIKSISNNDDKIKDYMSTNLISVDINNSIQDLLKKMKENKIKRILVSDKNKLVGIVSTSDIINSNIDSKEIFDLLKNIYTKDKTKTNMNTEVDQFYL